VAVIILWPAGHGRLLFRNLIETFVMTSSEHVARPAGPEEAACV